MLSTATRISILTLAFGFTLGAATAYAKGNTPTPPTTGGSDSSLVKASGGDSDTPAQAESLKFNTDVPAGPRDARPTMQFTDPGDTPLGSPRPQFAETSPEEAPFTSYIGYPKNQVGLYLEPENVSAIWTFNGRSYNFSSTATALGLDYKLIINPLWNLEFDYSNTVVKLSQAFAAPYTFESSSTTLNTYFFKGHYCFLSRVTFYRQICPGVDIGNDAYPVLQFLNSGQLDLTQVPDITVGANVSYQEPFGEHFLFIASLGYNMGTGLGNSGTLTSKSNSSYFAKAGTDYNVSEHNMVEAQLTYLHRTAKLDGFQGNDEYIWNTASSILGLRLAYMRSF